MTMPSLLDRTILLDPTKNLVDSMKTNNVSRIKSAINMPCVDLNIRLPKHQQMTILMRFCYLDITTKGRKDLAILVLKVNGRSSCDLNAQDLSGKTVLAHTCLQEDAEMVKLLADNGMVDADIGDNEGNTPLMHACRTGNASVVKTLIVSFKKWGLNVNATNNENISPLLEAARLGHIKVIRTLVIDGDADVSQRDKNRNIAQDYLVVSGKGFTTDFLLLCPTAQRKRLARERRVAEGRRSMMDLVNESPTPRTPTPDGGDKHIKPKKSKVIKPKKSKVIVATATQPIPGLASTTPFTQEYTGQLNSVVFQLAQCIPMLAEKPFEEDVENVEKVTPSRLLNPRRSSLSQLDDFQSSLFDKYMVNDTHNDDKNRSVMLSTKQKLLDRRLRLQPIKVGDGTDHDAPAMNSRYHRQRRSSLPTDIPKIITDLDDHTVRRSSFSRDVPNSERDQAKHPTQNGHRGSTQSLNDGLSTSPPKSNLYTSQRPSKAAMSKNTDPASRLQPIDVSDVTDRENAQAMNSRYHRQRRSSLPTDIPEFIKDLADHTVRRSTFSRDVSNSGCDQGKIPTQNGHRGSANPSKLAMSKNTDPASRLQPIDVSDGTDRENAPAMNSRYHRQRRSSLPMDIPEFITDLEDHTVRRSSFLRAVPNSGSDQGKHPTQNGHRGSANSLNDGLSTSPPKSNLSTSQRPSKATMSKNADPASPSSKTATRPAKILHPPKTTARRSSLPDIVAPSTQSPKTTSTSSRRRSTYPAKVKKTEPISIVHRPRALESGVTTSWQGRSSKTVPSYMFR
ncbi:uncharacterized protein [Amphiura filiformis]|uniref:uncharacterized protein n=1 Tax=Amphiura filiformis TaxID=82378 RepID=UPI003B217A74